MEQEVSIEKALQAYRVISMPSDQSWRSHKDLHYTSANLFECNEEEKNRFFDELSEIPITIHQRITTTVDDIFDPLSLKDLIYILTDPSNKSVQKIKRKVVFSTADGKRPVSSNAFISWNGFQVIDMDIKSKAIATRLKYHIFNTLKRCNWFLGVALSSSGKGLHIYTKITIPEDFKENPKKCKLLYLANFRHKYSFVYLACLNAIEQIGFTKNELVKWMDLAMFRPQQGAFIGYDEHPMINTGFFEDFIYISFDNVEDIGHPEVDWVSYPDLKEIFSRWEWFEESDDNMPEINVLNASGPDGKTHDKVHYKHNERWRLANTLVNIFGVNDAIKYLRSITSNKVSDRELIADCTTANRHNKPVDIWAVNRLNKLHGFNIKIDIENIQVGEEDLFNSMDRISNPNIIRQSKNYKEFYINKTQYLSDILSDIIESIGRVTLIEAGPGLGKTEMVKRLVKMKKKVMMILPFTSIIKSKVETEEGWCYSYGSKKPKLDVENGLALTIDKFSRLNSMDIKLAGFDYIFLDESHLLFMSEYRPVMPKVIEMIRNSEVPIILMSGTPTGELVFFNDIVHLKVVKEETRKKELQINLVQDQKTLLYHMCRAMATDIADGKRVLFPTNEGTTFSKRIKAGIEYFMKTDHAMFDEVNLQYYKKSNLGESFMDDVNFKKTIKNTQVVMCTTYMGCGVDIEDKYNFQIYFGDLCTAAECDQWCNRLRNNDLFVKVYVSKTDADGNPRELHKFRPMKFQLDDEELMNVHSILRMCNTMLERNPMEYKYNPIIASIIKDNRFIVYDEIKNKYYINEIAYKTVVFERKFRDYTQQLPVFMKGMQSYGYKVSVTDLGQFIVEGAEVFSDLKTMIKLASDDQLVLNTQYINELLDLITEDRLKLYSDVLNGQWEIRKGFEWEEDNTQNIMTVKSVEVFEKVVPIFLSMTKRFSISTVKEIFEYCMTNNRYNFAAINRIRTLVNIIESKDNNQLDLPIGEFMDASWNFAEQKTCTKQELNQFIIDFVYKYADSNSTINILIKNSPLTIKKLKNTFEKLFKCLVNCSRPSNGVITMQKQELLWKKREFYSGDKNDKLYILEDFLDAYIKVEKSEYEQGDY